MNCIGDHIAVIDGREILLRRSGSGAGPTVLLVHALGLDRRSFDPLRRALDGAVDLVSYDHCGHGNRAADEHFTLQTLVDDAVAVIRSIGWPLHLLGHALGGVIATLAAARARDAVQSLTVVATPIRSMLVFAERASRIDAGEMKVVAEESLQRWFAGLEGVPASRDAVAYGQDALSGVSPRAYANGWRALASFGGLALDDEDLPPTLYVAAADDASVPASSLETFADRGGGKLAALQVEVLPRGGHMLPLTEPDRLASILARHWKVFPA